jgi:drug/metabolite transporter (DMT)-like permease
MHPPFVDNDRGFLVRIKESRASALAALIGTMEAPLGAAWAWIGVGEVPRRETIIGGIIVLAAVIFRLLLDMRNQRAPEGTA